ncbi:dihydropteroate synthase [Acrocarpospora phusangensis]|uniref:Dihydropteroate synthase n=1 Tax=Acrocarpospora phusangensis TaxID=1070424 RepID=A0A919QJR7_9ACTN|nr:dihydropteroate synthase [Acrocarpospora phusangensis]GIH28948.1 dihydropteroate synthase [Acrocarpospora phusangensis]
MKLGARTFDFSRQVAVMAIINRTPDSFHDRGRTFALDKAVEAALAAEAEGADWLDIGGVPFGPDGPQVEVAEEIDRVVPLIAAVRAATDAVISVDTHRGAVAQAALDAGADVVNDTSGVSDPGLAAAVAAAGAGLVVTHSLSGPRVRHPRPTYQDVTSEVVAFLRDRVAFARNAGVAADKIIVDPGHDLNKNTLHTLALTRRLPELAGLGYPLLVALSNKDFIGETLGRAQHDRLSGSLAAAVFCVLNGARIIRVHDVRASVDAVRMTEALLGWREPADLRHNM